jgi:hypothetical protein
VRWWRKSPGSCSSLLVCLSLALLSLPTGKSASSTAVSTNTISSLPYPAGGLHPGPSRFCASSLRLIQRVAIHEKYVGPPVVVIIKILTPLLPVVSINYFFDSTPPFPLSVRSPACCATSMNPRLCADRVASSPRRISSITISGGGFSRTSLRTWKQWRGRSHRDALAKRQQREFAGWRSRIVLSL